ncbi:MAG: hypothetical protein AB1778_05030 [Candidatus Bipolaricaulota bacterium]
MPSRPIRPETPWPRSVPGVGYRDLASVERTADHGSGGRRRLRKFGSRTACVATSASPRSADSRHPAADRGLLSATEGLASRSGDPAERSNRRAVRHWLAKLLLALAAILALTSVAFASPLPVVLVYGFQPVPGFDPLRIWETFASALSGRSTEEAEWIDLGDHGLYFLAAFSDVHRDVFVAHYATPYEPTVRSLMAYAARLAVEMTWAAARSSEGALDMVGHSMGGLIGLIASCADQFGLASGPPASVRTLITLATPHHGTEMVAFPLWPGPLWSELAPGSPLLAATRAAARFPLRVVTMAGQSCAGCGLRPEPAACLEQCVADGLAGRGSDLVITMDSAWLDGAERTACIGMNHVDMHAHPELARCLPLVLDGQTAPQVLWATSELRAVTDDPAPP